MHQTLKVKEELRERPKIELELRSESEQEQEPAHLQYELHQLANQQHSRDKQPSLELEMAAESKEISSVEQDAAAAVVMEGGNRCAGCREPIRDKFIFSVIDLNWHQDCVQCADCLLKLNERCHTFDGKLYCRQDYWRRFGPKCFACKQSIERNELVQIIKGNRIYHLKCFTCSECNKQLKAGEQLHLIEGKRLLCKQDYHHQIGCKSPSSDYLPSNNNNNNISNNNSSKSNSCFQSKTDSAQQHTISATYYTLMGGHKRQEEQKVQDQTPIRRSQTKTELKQHSADEAADCDEMEDELEAYGDEEADGEQEEVELEEEGVSLDEMLGLEADNNLENEENRFGQTRDSLEQTSGGLSASIDQRHLSGPNRLRKGSARPESLADGEVKRRRRRRKKLQTAAGAIVSSGPNSTGLKRLTNRNGESILNGMPPASSILAVHGSTTSSLHQAGPHHQHNQLIQQPNSHQKSVPSSAASTASDSSTSSSASLNNHHQSSNHGSSQHHQRQHGQHQHLTQTQTQTQNQHQNTNHIQQQQSCGQRSASGQSGGGHKPTRVRTVLNEKQLQTLRDCYAHNPRPDALMKEQLVEMTGLSSRVIRVWFQNKRCKDKKKSIQHKQMLQYEKNGPHLAGLTLMRGVPMVASSPIQYDDHSTVSSTAGLTQQQSGTTMLELQSSGSLVQSGRDTESSPLMADPQQHSSRPGGHFAQASVHSPANQPPTQQQHQHQHQHPQQQQQQQQPQPVDIHAYQPPWKNLIEYANHGATPIDRLNTSSPRYQQLIGQIHGYSSSRTENALTNQAERVEHPQSALASMAELQPTDQFHQPNQSVIGFSGTPAPSSTPLLDQQQQQPPMGHMHLFQH